jgi:glycosyltransferase involved in cell wall biosynthesis
MMPSPRKIRVLQVLGALHQGGVETWLLHVARQIDRSAFELDFLVHTDQPAAYDDDVRSLGSRILPCLHPSQPWQYGVKFKAIVREHGPYDVVHSHVHDYSGYVLRLARQAGVPVRIAHSHLDSTQNDQRAGVFRRRYLALMKHWIRQHATGGLGCSRRAAAALFGAAWERDPRWQLFFCGIDLAPFQADSERTAVRREFHVPDDVLLVGHVGRFDYQKNHKFLVEIIQEAVRQDRPVRLLAIGGGPLRSEIEQQVDAAGLRDHVIFAGLRRDVPRLMRGMDAFVLPSHFEGLPIVLMEAQAAGLPCVISEAVDEDATVIPALVTRLPLTSAADWVAAIEASRQLPADEIRSEALRTLAGGPFNIRNGVDALERMYRDQLSSRPRRAIAVCGSTN